MGSLYTATASYLDARANGGRWLIRIEDLDAPRVVPGSTANILHTLERFGFEWDELVRQSERIERYEAALDTLRAGGMTFECSCSRTQLADEGPYPGYCRVTPRQPGAPTATRLRVAPGHIQFTDRIQGTFRQDVSATAGDMVVRRRDRLFAYVLAVVVDDQAQGVTHVVRGADLLDNTPRQIYLIRQLGFEPPVYSHVPVLTEADGRKLAKSARSIRVEAADSLRQLLKVLDLLGLAPPSVLAKGSLSQAWEWALEQWNIDQVAKRLTQPVGR